MESTQSKTKNRRRRILINKALQLKYTYFILFLIILYSACLGFAMYNNARISSKVVTEYVQENQKLTQKLATIDKTVLITIIAAMILNAIVITYTGIFSTHKVAGPIYRFKKHLENIRTGNFALHTKLRKNDLLLDIAEDLNTTSDFLKNSTENDIKAIEAFGLKLDSLSNAIKTDKVAGKDISIAIDEITKEINTYTSGKKNVSTSNT